MGDSFLHNFSAMAWQKLTDSHPPLKQRDNVLLFSTLYQTLGRRCHLDKRQTRLLLNDWQAAGKIRLNCRGLYFIVGKIAAVEAQK